MSEKLQMALAYASKGYLVVPLHSIRKDKKTGRILCTCGNPECGKNTGKHPRISGGVHSASRNPVEIREWFTRWPYANIGLRMGAAPAGSGYIAFDIDVGSYIDKETGEKKQKKGRETLEKLEAELGKLPKTVAAKTGSGGYHLIYKHPGGFRVKPQSNILKSLFGEGSGFDVRGDDSYIVVEPSIHMSGNRYEWIRDCSPFEKEPAELPPAWVEFLQEISKGDSASTQIMIGHEQLQHDEKTFGVEDENRVSMTEIFAYWRNHRRGFRISNGEIRFDCPAHGGDNGSFAMRLSDGVYNCFNTAVCGISGRIKEAVDWEKRTGKKAEQQPGQWLVDWLKQKGLENEALSLQKQLTNISIAQKPEIDDAVIERRTADVRKCMKRLTPDSPAARFIERRGFTVDFVRKYGFGYATPEDARKIFYGQPYARVTVPHTTPEGEIINIYGRTINEADQKKTMKHSHLSGTKGLFNAKAVLEDTVFVCEGVFDALVLERIGFNACAIFGSDSVPWGWFKAYTVWLCLDRDAQETQKKLAIEARMRGMRVYALPVSIYDGYKAKDLNELWIETGGRIALVIKEIVESVQSEEQVAATSIESDPREDYQRYIETFRASTADIRAYIESKKDLDEDFADLWRRIQKAEWVLDRAVRIGRTEKIAEKVTELEEIYEVVRRIREEEKNREWARFLRALREELPDCYINVNELAAKCALLPPEVLPSTIRVPIVNFNSGKISMMTLERIVSNKIQEHVNKDYDGLCLLRNWGYALRVIPTAEKEKYMDQTMDHHWW